MFVLQSISESFLTVKETLYLCGAIGSIIITVVTNNIMTKAKIKEVEAKNVADYALADMKINNMVKQLEEVRDNFELLEKQIGGQLNEVTKGLNNMALSFADFKNEMIKFIYENKR